jgi:hypothetical protein
MSANADYIIYQHPRHGRPVFIQDEVLLVCPRLGDNWLGHMSGIQTTLTLATANLVR